MKSLFIFLSSSRISRLRDSFWRIFPLLAMWLFFAAAPPVTFAQEAVENEAEVADADKTEAEEESPPAPPEPPVPLWDREPFDRIILKTTRSRNTFDVQRLTLPKGVTTPTVEALQQATGKPKLQVRLLDDPNNLREVAFGTLDRIQRYEDILLAEAQSLIGDGKFDAAYECLKFMQAEYPQTRGLNQAYQLFLEREAANYIRQKNYEMALVRVYALVALNPKYPRLAAVYVPLVQQLVKANLQAKEYAVAGQYMAELQKTLPDDPGVKKLAAEVDKLADTMLRTTQTALKENDLNTAITASRAAAELCPGRAQAVKLAADIRKKYPQVNVGITWCANQYQPLGIHDWASLRSRRLLYRPLVEFLGPGPEGGNYVSPLADLKVENLNRTLRLNIYDNVGWNGTDIKLTAYDLSRQFLEMINPQSPQYAPLFAEIFQELEADSANEVRVHFRRPHVIPAALVQTPVLPYTSGEGIAPDTATNGPFVLTAMNGKPVYLHDGRPVFKNPEDARAEAPVTAVRYVTSVNYFHDQSAGGSAGADNRPLQIVETHFDKGRNALLALRSNHIQVLDRVNPWELDVLRAEEGITVVPYSVPRVHVLLPNRDTRVLSNRTFRRALVYGINRQTILSHLLGGKSMTGCQVVSGPFSRGTSFSDPLSYAYDTGLTPRTYDPYLATTLARVGVTQSMTAEELKADEARRRKEAEAKKKAESAKTEDGQPVVVEAPTTAPMLPMAPLVLGHPPHELARVSCQQIKAYLEMIGVPVTLYEFGLHEPVELRNGIDLLYAELTMAEPLLDARRLLSAQGPTRRSSSHMDLALRQLDTATDWVEISRTLRRIHRLSHDDTAVIPLWQIVEHFAYNRSLEGIGETPFTLYEHIEDWRLK